MVSLNTAPVLVGTTAVDLISGAALSGLVGAPSPSPKVLVKTVNVPKDTSSYDRAVTLFKGASGGSASATKLVIIEDAGAIAVPLNIVLEAGEYLTAIATSSGGSFSGIPVTVSAEITF